MEMPDREKVEKGLNICTSAEPCNGCPYLGERNCSLEMVKDTLALLKEQDHLIENLEYSLEITESNLRHYINGND